MSDTIWLDVLPSLRGFGADLVKGTGRAARDAGRNAGSQFKRGFESGADRAGADQIKQIETRQKQASGLVSKLSGDVSKARQAHQRATAAVVTAEQRLTDAIQKHGAESAQAQAAQLRLNAARERAAQTEATLENRVEALGEAKKAETAVTKELETAQKSLAKENEKSSGLWGRLRENMRNTGGAADHARKRIDQLKTGFKMAGVGIATATTAVAGFAATIAGVAIKGGINRALDIEDARASMRGLGHDTKTIDSIMENALASVKGTAFGLGDAASIAAQAVASGIKPGEDLERTLKLTANSAALARVGLDEMGSILTKVWTSGRVQTDELNQLADRGIPIWQKLAESYGVSATELRDMVSAGKVDAQTFADVLENTVGDAALSMGDTTRGAWKNMMAALARGGEAFVNGILPKFRAGLDALTGLFDNIAPAAEAAGAAAGKVLDRIWTGAEGLWNFLTTGRFNEGLRSAFNIDPNHPFMGFLREVRNTAMDMVGAFRENVLPALQNFGDFIVNSVLPHVGRLAAIIGGTLWAALKTAGGFIMNTVVPAFSRLVDFLRQNMDWIAPLAAAVIAAKVAYEAWAFGVLAVQNAQKLATAAQVAFNAVMNANPIMLVVTAVAALVAGLVYFFTQTETGRKIWQGFTDALVAGWQRFSGFFVDLWNNTIKPAWDGFTGAIQKGYNTYIKPTVDKITSIFTNAGGQLDGVFNFIREAQENWANNFRWIYDTIIAPVIAFVVLKFNDFRAKVTTAINAVKAGWQIVVQAIRSLWNTYGAPAIQAVQTAFTVMWQRFIRPLLDTAKNAWNGFVNLLRSAWNNIGKPTIDLIGRIFTNFVNKTFGPVMRGARGIWQDFTTALKSIWNNFGKPVIDTIMNLIKGDFPAAFRSARDAIKGIWKSVANVARTPVNFVIRTVYNDGLRATFNNISSKLGLKWRLPKGKTIPAFAKGGRMQDGWKLVGEEGPELINTGPGYVYTAKETKKMLAGAQQAPMDALPAFQGADMSESLLPAGGFWSNIWGGIKKKVGEAKDWVVGKIAAGVRALVKPLKTGIRNFLPGAGINELIRGAAIKVIDDMVNWAVKTDDKKAAEQAAAGGSSGAIFDGPRGKFHRPSRGPFTSMYGPRWGGWHAGVDIAGGGPTYAAMDGVVSKVGWNAVVGRTGLGIILNHGPGLWTYYGHNPVGGVVVKPGQKVKGGQRIGAQGATGNVTGVHLHFEVHEGRVGRDVNPMKYMKYDQGGILDPGPTPVVNKTGKPEYVFTTPQWATLERLAARGASINELPAEINVTINVEDLEGLKTIEEFIKMARRRARQKTGASA